MDKYELVLEIIEHPEKYSSDRLAELLADPETREIYNLLCNADSAMKARKEPDLDAEWENFAERHFNSSRRIFSWFGSRAASIAAIVCTSIVAVAAGIAVTVSVIDQKQNQEIPVVKINSSSENSNTEDSTVKNDMIDSDCSPVMFEDEPLVNVMNAISKAYGIEVKFSNPEAASLHLYYKLDQSLPLNVVIEQLNTFQQINIRQEGSLLIID